MSNLIIETFENLIAQGPRVKWLEKWLLGKVWTAERYRDLSPADYLNDGESKVNQLEEIVARAAYRVYDEFLGELPQERDILHLIEGEDPFAIVIFDGLSLREIPVLFNLAEKSGLAVREIGTSYSTLPTETIDFIENRLKFGSIAPSQLPRSREVKQKGIAAYYYDNPSQQHPLDTDSRNLLLWSAFPDNTYSDSGARFAQHFEQIHTLLETAWLNTVQQIPRRRRILVTSDHGYVYLGSGLSFVRSNSELRPLTEYLGGERYKRLTEEGDQPPDHPDLVVYPNRKVAVLRGRIQTHPPGKVAGRLYKHGGLSIMEILTPWVVLEKE
ncbi:hypothetical protein HKBW3S44_01361 [Candidatus Hakubella thermalkaliphila]|uniref:PglZ domain-containing protein n=1 Tax=Candidatus Hakubella thermalkaliphila TaxID=2754717 RepID=A0A6V8Q9Q3_9ACTN|nr:hypothetical protein [Candidatus Hakubella thermalkaliphila]GFP37684.1 hypothetical protein HKBW3S44_01361 [Candidatus Hakubella thermalkaliphila]GFP38511.1 hypothetical protein HKBW3S47_00212 [Candidatus Hakubella thermalkaliphila]GFP41502.1 hypothetical protein HKBW3C_00627 [Candidatus Hakubella thermalkaliphila]